MSVLWCGGEDIDFPNSTGAVTVTTGAGFRIGYARSTVSPSSGIGIRSSQFPGGGVTSCWVTVRAYMGSQSFATPQGFGLVLHGTMNGLYIGLPASGSTKVGLSTYNGTTVTTLAQESGGSMILSTIIRFDIQIINYGASGTVNVYANGVLIITYTGNIAVGGVSQLDTVASSGANTNWQLSEIIVADEDTRNWLGLLTMAPNANGTTINWSNNAYTNYNPTTINDANTTFVNATAQDQQANLVDEPAGTFVVKTVKIAARALATAGAASTNLQLGFNSGGTVAVAASHALTTTMTTYEDYFTQNPVTSAPWGTSTEMNALQLDFRSA